MPSFRQVFLPALALTLAWSAPAMAVEASETAIRANLDKSLEAFNKGDFPGYLHDFAQRIHYNGITVDRSRLVEINQELKQSFPNLKMSYKTIRISPMGAREATASTSAEFTGSTKSYDGSSLPATYREAGEITAFYKGQGNDWKTDQLQISWNDSFIDIGESFGAIGFTTLPALVGTEQPYRMRLFTGEDGRMSVAVNYAYAIVPLNTVMAKEGAEEVFRALKFQEMPDGGLDMEKHAPKQAGTYAHVLVVNKFSRLGQNERLHGQKIYTRLVRVE